MLNENGYYRPTYEEIVASKEQKARDLFGDDIDTGELTPLGKFIRINAYDLSKAYEDLEKVYYARFPNTATGTSLDRLCVFAGISRNPATHAQHKIRVYGEQGYSFGMGELIVCGADSDITFYNINSYTINQTTTIGGVTVYYCDAIVECAIAGTVGNVTITDIVNPITNIDDISYLSVEQAGEDIETDVELRKRFSLAIVGSGATNTNSIRAAILRVPTVKSVNVIENNTNSTVSSRPAHSFECYVCGGDDYEQEIAQAIFEKKPIGIQTCSTSSSTYSVSKTIVDDSGTSHTINFSHTEDVPIYVAVSYKKNSQFEGTAGETQIKNALVEHINGLGVNTDVVLSSLYGYIYRVTGVTDVTALTIGTSAGSLSTSNITINANQIASIVASNITLQEVT